MAVFSVVAIDTHIGYMASIYEYTLFDFDIFDANSIENIKINIIAILPTNFRFIVKNSKHQSIFSMPLIISKTMVNWGIFDLDIQIERTIPNAIYMILHMIGMNISGIHSLGRVSVEYQSIPRFTNILPSIATTDIQAMIIIIFIRFDFLFSIEIFFDCYS